MADNLVAETKKLLGQANTEEDLRIGFEKVLEPIKNELEITSIPARELLRLAQEIYRNIDTSIYQEIKQILLELSSD